VTGRNRKQDMEVLAAFIGFRKESYADRCRTEASWNAKDRRRGEVLSQTSFAALHEAKTCPMKRISDQGENAIRRVRIHAT
jgi:hypothetical protein